MALEQLKAPTRLLSMGSCTLLHSKATLVVCWISGRELGFGPWRWVRPLFYDVIVQVPPNVHFEVDDVEADWTYSEKFDFIHCRTMGNAIQNWPRLVKQCHEFTKPGGWAEFVDIDLAWVSPDNSMPADSACLKINTEFIKATRDAGMEPSPGPLVEGMMKDVGFVNIHHQRYPLPVGTWPADKHLKEIGAWNYLQCTEGLEAFCYAIFTRALGYSKEEVEVLCAKARKELKDSKQHAMFYLHVCYGQKKAEPEVYLQTLFPLIACGFSLIHITIRLLRHAVTPNPKKGYIALNGTGRPTDIPKDVIEDEDEADEATCIDEEAENERLTLRKTISTSGSVAEVSRPRGALLLVIVEILALLGEVGISLAALITHAGGRHARIATISRLCVWGYILVLTCLRLLLPNLKRNPLPKLWNHTAILFSIQWLCTVILFRTSIIHSQSRLAQALTVTDFVLASLLAIIAITARKGNRTVILKYEEKLEPSREPLASLLSIATFSWVDAIVWRGYIKTLELSDVWNLLPTDRAANVLADFRQIKKTSKFAWRLLKHFRRDLLLQQAWTFLSSLLTFAPTLLLKAILEYVEQPESTTPATAWLWVTLLAVAGIVGGISDGQALWIGRKICIRLRAIMVAEIYAKTLRRRAAIGADADLSEDKSKSIEDGITKEGTLNRLRSLFRKKKSPKDDSGAAKEGSEDKQVNSGTIINLMSVDSFKVSEISAYFHFLFPSVPVQLVIAITLLYKILGWSSIAGIAVMLLLMPLNLFFAKQFSSSQKRIMAGTDGRIHTTNEVLQNIRIIKYFSWELRFAQDVDDKRRVELKALRYKYIIWTFAATVWYGVPILITGFSFFLYTAVEKKQLVPSIAFTALSLFGLLRFPLDRLADMTARILESKVSVDRIEAYLNEKETGKYIQLSGSTEQDLPCTIIGFDDATFTWAGKDDHSRSANAAFRMINIDVKFHVGSLNVIAGPTGSGKTSLLMALLGEMTLVTGTVHLPSGSREDLNPDSTTGLTESVAYCAQQAWLVNDTIKQNILFASPYDEDRYNSVINACALRRDLEVLESGDATLVGEKGIVVSGGQKQRISLARALYCNSKHVLLDDCLSAVDSHTAQHIFDNAILGPLMMHRTCILVTHNIALCAARSQFIVVLANGKIAAQGDPREVMISGALGEDASRPASKSGTRPPSRSGSKADLQSGASTDTNAEDMDVKPNGQANGSAKNSKAKPQADDDDEGANARTEGKAEGAVHWQVIQMYFASMGSSPYWILTVLMFAIEPVAQMATNLWIRQWSNSYSTSGIHMMETLGPSNSTSRYDMWKVLPLDPLRTEISKWSVPYLPARSAELYAWATPSEVDIGYYLGVYASLGIIYVIICIFRLLILFYGSLSASNSIHTRLLNAVLRAKFKFFDTTPLGQIMNRFSKDLQAIDQEVAAVAAGVVQGVLNIVAIVILISVITPGFLIAGILLSIVYFCIGMFYVRSSRDLKRLESIQRSPLYQQFGETLSGIITIRAYGDERRFVRDNFSRINTHNRPFIYLWAANRWLALRIDWAGAFVAFFAGAFVVANVGRIDAGAAGLSLTYALTFNESILWLVRLYADNEQNMNHVERVKQYLELEQEAKAIIPENRPPGNWPSKGKVEFVNYSTRYRSDLNQVLKRLNIKMAAEEKVGIVGRTGAGKSSLAMALFRGLEADEGKILIDDIDIGLIGLQDLRENITIVPQDPTLFTGTIRSNLDPFGLFTDEEIFTALRRVHLIGSSSSSTTVTRPSTPGPSEDPSSASSTNQLAPPSNDHDNTGNDLSKVTTNTRENTNIFLNLSSSVAESGSNLSQGQRQLLCLARALLKSPRVLLMDEATASIDYATDAKIQNTLRELKGSTIITIAHRLQTIIDYDKVLVLDKGEVVEYDAPWELMKLERGIFRGMCEMSGDFETLQEGARRAGEKKQLVDV
ncbi:hypothetical protein MMC18_001183 [Xylographa bjoerkii]|nr:hypothetical protein [Xylographa bjoerkii]